MLIILRWLRKAVGIFDFVVFTVFLYLLTFVPWRGKHPVAYIFRAWCRAFVRALNVDLYVHQKNKAHLPQRYILVANHPSAFEDIGIPAVFDVVSLAKREVQDWFIVGRISKACGTLYVDREDPESRRQAIGMMVDAVNQGHNIGLYPEGGCKGRRLFPEFKSGAFEVAKQTGLPILPVFLHYEAQDDFEWQPPYTLPNKIRHMFFSINNRVNFYILDPVNPQDFADKYAMKAHGYEVFAEYNRRYLE